MPMSSISKRLFRLSGARFAVAALALIAPIAAHATPITYNVVLTETDGNGHTYSGIGQVTLDVTGGVKNYTGYKLSNGLTSMHFTIDGQTFDIKDATSQGTPTFGLTNALTGGIWDVTFSETNANGYRLVANGSEFIFYTPGNHPVSIGWTGDFTGSVAPPPISSNVAHTPEPSTIALLGTGLLAWRRRRGPPPQKAQLDQTSNRYIAELLSPCPFFPEKGYSTVTAAFL